jgi:excisionase family DNA binding protein
MENPEKEKLVGVDEVADYIGVKSDTVRMWVRKGYLPGYKLGKLWKLKMSDVDKWLDSRATSELEKNQEDSPNA